MVVGKVGAVILKVQDATGKVHRVHKDHLKSRESVDSWTGDPVADDVIRSQQPALSQREQEFPLPFPEVEEDARSVEDTDPPSTDPTSARTVSVALPPPHQLAAGDVTRRYPLRRRKAVDRYQPT